MAGLRGRTTALLLAIFIIAVLFTWCGKITSPKPEEQKAQPAPYRPVINGFYTNGRGPGSSYSSLEAHAGLIDEISPLWYHVGKDGTLVPKVDREALKTAEVKGIKVLPLVALSPGGRDVLSDPAARERAVNRIAQEVIERNYSGINIDFEFFANEGGTYQDEREGLSLLAAGLKEKLKTLGKRLDVCVTPPVGPPSHLARIYDYGQLAQTADRLVLMAYDYSHPGSLPGPVAPLPWVEENIRALLAEGASPDMISLGIAAYGYDWPSGKSGGTSRSSDEILRTVGKTRVEVSWDAKSETPFIRYTAPGGGQRETWFENSRAAAKKIGLAEKYRLAGVSVWRLGYEDSEFWQLVESGRQP